MASRSSKAIPQINENVLQIYPQTRGFLPKKLLSQACEYYVLFIVVMICPHLPKCQCLVFIFIFFFSCYKIIPKFTNFSSFVTLRIFKLKSEICFPSPSVKEKRNKTKRLLYMFPKMLKVSRFGSRTCKPPYVDAELVNK